MGRPRGGGGEHGHPADDRVHGQRDCTRVVVVCVRVLDQDTLVQRELAQHVRGRGRAQELKGQGRGVAGRQGGLSQIYLSDASCRWEITYLIDET